MPYDYNPKHSMNIGVKVLTRYLQSTKIHVCGRPPSQQLYTQIVQSFEKIQVRIID